MLGVSVGLLALSSSTSDGWLVLLAGLGVGLVAAALLLHPRLAPLDVVVTLPARARVGDEVALHVAVTNGGRRTSVPLTLQLVAPSLKTVTVRVPALAPGDVAVSEPSVTARRRGEVAEVVAVLHTTAPFSMIAVVNRRRVAVSMLVHPSLGAALTDTPGGTGDLTSTTSNAPGVEVQGVREWHRGEPTGRLYARGTARHGRPLVLDRHDDLGLPGLTVVVGAVDEVAVNGGSPQPSGLHELMIEIVAATLVARASDGIDVTAATRQRDLGDVTSTDPATLLDWCARLGSSDAPTLADIDRAAGAAGPDGAVVLAQLSMPTDPTVLSTLARAVESRGARLQLLHRMDGRNDALCLHEVRADAVEPHLTGATS